MLAHSDIKRKRQKEYCFNQGAQTAKYAAQVLPDSWGKSMNSRCQGAEYTTYNKNQKISSSDILSMEMDYDASTSKIGKYEALKSPFLNILLHSNHVAPEGHTFHYGHQAP